MIIVFVIILKNNFCLRFFILHLPILLHIYVRARACVRACVRAYFISVTTKFCCSSVEKLIFMVLMEKCMLLICNVQRYTIYRRTPIWYVALRANCTIKLRFKFNSSSYRDTLNTRYRALIKIRCMSRVFA